MKNAMYHQFSTFLSLREEFQLIRATYLQYLDNPISLATFAEKSHTKIKYTGGMFTVMDWY